MKSATLHGKTFLIVGATSAIAGAVVRRLTELGARVVIAARKVDDLARLRADVETRHGSPCFALAFDAEDREQVTHLFMKALEHAPAGLDGVIACHGITPDEGGWLSGDEVRRTFEINLISVAVILNDAGKYFAEKRDGVIAAVSSVAGDRGRQSNFVYGGSKAGLSVFLQGLRNRLHPCGVHVLTIKPGFVDTPMTQGKKLPARFLVASPARVADDIVRAIQQRTDTVYTPWFWRWIMTVIRLIPEPIFKRMRL